MDYETKKHLNDIYDGMIKTNKNLIHVLEKLQEIFEKIDYLENQKEK